MPELVQRFVVEDAEKASSLMPQHVALVKPDGTPYLATGPKGPKGDKGIGVKAISLTKDASGAITGGVATLTDGATLNIAVTTATS